MGQISKFQVTVNGPDSLVNRTGFIVFHEKKLVGGQRRFRQFSLPPKQLPDGGEIGADGVGGKIPYGKFFLEILQ